MRGSRTAAEKALRSALVLLVFVCSPLSLSDAAAATVSWDGRALDGTGRLASLALETSDTYNDGRNRAFDLDLAFTVDGRTYSLATTFRQTRRGLTADGFDLTFDVVQKTLTLTVQNADALPPDGLGSITFAFASFPNGNINLNSIVKLFERTDILTVMSSTADGAVIDTLFGPALATPVPLPGAALFALTGFGLLGVRRLVELGGIEPPTS